MLFQTIVWFYSSVKYYIAKMTASSKFQPLQLVCIAGRSSCLYAEVIQIVEERQMGWVRPLALLNLVEGASEPAVSPVSPQIAALEAAESALCDLRQGADLLCPLSLLHAALDTEVIPILMALDSLPPKDATHRADLRAEYRIAHSQLQAFVFHLWEAHPEAFQS
jgi:hypothetical protein